MRFLLSTLLGLVSLAALASSNVTVESSVECHTFYGSKRTTWWHTSQTSSECHSVSTSTVTKTTTQRKPAVTTTHLTTITIAAPAFTSITTTTASATSITTTTSATITTSSVTSTSLVTYYEIMGTLPPSNAPGRRRTAPPAPQTLQQECQCTVWEWHCTPWVSTKTKTQTHTQAASTATVTSTITVRTTPTVTKTYTVTTTSTSTSTAVSTSGSITTVSTTTFTVTRVFSSFLILASNDPEIPDGYTLGDNNGQSQFQSGNTVWELDPSNGQLYTPSTNAVANAAGTGGQLSSVFLLPKFLLGMDGELGDICDCSIDGLTLVLRCNCDGDTVLQTDDQDYLYTAGSLNSGYDAVTLVVQPLLN